MSKCSRCTRELASTAQQINLPRRLPLITCSRLGCENLIFCPDCYSSHILHVHKVLVTNAKIDAQVILKSLG